MYCLSVIELKLLIAHIESSTFPIIPGHSLLYLLNSIKLSLSFSTPTLLTVEYIMSYLHWLWQNIHVPRINWILFGLLVEVLIFIITFITWTAISWLSDICIGIEESPDSRIHVNGDIFVVRSEWKNVATHCCDILSFRLNVVID